MSSVSKSMGRLVCGINDSRIQRRLLSEPNLTFQKAFDLALAMHAESYSFSTLRCTCVAAAEV